MPAGAKKQIHRGGEQGFLFVASIDIGLCTGYLAGHSGERRVILTSHAKIPITVTDHSSFLSGWMTAANQRILNHGIWFDSLCLCNIEELNRNTILNDVKSDCALFFNGNAGGGQFHRYSCKSMQGSLSDVPVASEAASSNGKGSAEGADNTFSKITLNNAFAQ